MSFRLLEAACLMGTDAEVTEVMNTFTVEFPTFVGCFTASAFDLNRKSKCLSMQFAFFSVSGM